MNKWLVNYALACVGAVVAVLAALWVSGAFEGLGLGLEGTVALAAGVVVTTAAGVGLMALVFASDRSRKDDEVYLEAQPQADAENRKSLN